MLVVARMRRRLAVIAALEFFVALAGCGKKRAEVRAVDEHEGESTQACSPIPSLVDRDVPIGEGCKLVVERTVVVRAKLTIGAGTTVAFDGGAGLRVEGGTLVTRGRENAPVLFTSHAPTKTAGDWPGVRSIESTGSALAFTTIEYAGGAWAAAPSTSSSVAPPPMKHFGIKGGALVATKTTFTAAETKPTVAYWRGIDLTDADASTTIDGCTLESARGNGLFAAVIRTPLGPKPTIARTTFTGCEAPAFVGAVDCHGYEATSLHNASTGQLLCASEKGGPFVMNEEMATEMAKVLEEMGTAHSDVIGGAGPVDAGAPKSTDDSGEIVSP